MLAAIDDGAIVGGAGAFTFRMTVPGGAQLGTAGVTVVGVLPTHRRRGILRSMMRAQLDDIHERGEPLAALWASEETIYGRYGYGLASLALEFGIPRIRGAFREGIEPVGRVRLVDQEEAAEADAAGLRRRPAPHARDVRAVRVVVGVPPARRPARVPLRRRAEAAGRARGRRPAAGVRDLPAERRLRQPRPGDDDRHARGRGRDPRRDGFDLALPPRRRLDADRVRPAPARRQPALPAARTAHLLAPGDLRRALDPAGRRRRGARAARVRRRRGASSSTSATSSARGTRAAGGSGRARRRAPTDEARPRARRLRSRRPLPGRLHLPRARSAPAASRSCARARSRARTSSSARTSRPGARRSSSREGRLPAATR